MDKRIFLFSWAVRSKAIGKRDVRRQKEWALKLGEGLCQKNPKQTNSQNSDPSAWKAKRGRRVAMSFEASLGY